MLTRQGVPVSDLIGDLPIGLDEVGRIRRPVEWSHLVDFMQRLERHLGGREALERCGERIGSFKPASFLRSIAGLSASPYALYRAASHWALRRGIPGVHVRIEDLGAGQIEIHAEIAPGLRACSQLFSFATGATRCLPRLLGSGDAVVSADIGERTARFRIAVPPSRSLGARIRRLARAVFSSGSVLQFMEAQQLELHAKHAALQQTHAALAASERRYRAITDAALDVLCEIDETGRIVYVSASIQDLIGYSPDQVTGSHFRLWIPSRDHARTSESFAAIASKPPGRTISHEPVTLHSAHGGQIVAEISVRSYRTPEGSWRMVGILRDMTQRSRSEPMARGEHAARRMPPLHQGRTAHEIQGLRAAIGRIRGDQPEHPLEGSLSRLLLALESPLESGDVLDPSDMLEATRRMTQVVESAMAQAQNPATKSHWIDSSTLARMIGEDFEAIRGADSPALEIDLSRSSAEIWGEETLLCAALGSLIDWAMVVSCARSGEAESGVLGPIRLAIGRSPAQRGVHPSIAFSIATRGRLPRAEDEGGYALATKAELAQAIARDAATALGGELEFDGDPEGPLMARLRLPQPDREI